MYAQITITAPYDGAALRPALIVQAGSASAAPVEALKDSVFASSAESVAPTVVAAQSIRKAVGLLAALLGFLVELTLFAYHGNEWVWEEAS